jgi:hypothetical protein
MPAPAPRPALQERVAAAILDGAARLFAVEGEQASMNDVAAAAGVARAGGQRSRNTSRLPLLAPPRSERIATLRTAARGLVREWGPDGPVLYASFRCRFFGLRLPKWHKAPGR